MNQIANAPSTKELLWLGCREKSCCYNSKVIISGQDMWRITQALELAPWDFTLYTEAVEGAVDAFQLVYSGPFYQVVLAKRGPVSSQGAPCVFLWKLADGHAQCGLGSLRPKVCLSYPAMLVDDMLRVESSHCTCRRWSLVDLDAEHEVALIEQVLAEAAEYSQIVATWNRGLTEANGERTYREFCSYVLNTYTYRYGANE